MISDTVVGLRPRFCRIPAQLLALVAEAYIDTAEKHQLPQPNLDWFDALALSAWAGMWVLGVCKGQYLGTTMGAGHLLGEKGVVFVLLAVVRCCVPQQLKGQPPPVLVPHD